MSIVSPSRFFWALVLCLAVFAAGCAGCRTESDSATGLALRFIETDPQVTFDLATLVRLEPIEAGAILDLSDLELWASPRGSSASVPGEDGVALRPSDGIATLRRVFDFDAGEVDGFELTLATPEGVAPRVHFFWAHADEEYSSSRRVEGRTAEVSEDQIRYDIRLRPHPEWTDRIYQLRVRFTSDEDEIVLRSIRPAKMSAEQDLLARLTGGGGKIELDSEVRNALPGLPGVPLERTLRVPSESELSFGYGLEPSVRGSVTFAVDAVSDDGSAQRLFEDTLVGGSDQARWHDAAVDLNAVSGQQVQLRLTTTSDVSINPMDGLVFWSNPEVATVPPAEAPPNIVLVSIDTLRADRLSVNGYHRPTSPNLEAWARQSATVFFSTVAHAPSTIPSHASMLTGINPHRHGVHSASRPVAPSLELLAEMLREAGYSTLAVTGGGKLHPRYGFSQGFDRYRFATTEEMQGGVELEIGVAKALEWIDEYRDRPFFLFFHTYEVHTPYRSRQPYYSQFTSLPPAAEIRNPGGEGPDPDDGFRMSKTFEEFETDENFEGLSSEEFREIVSTAYDSGVAYTDAHLAGLLGKLEDTQLADNTIVVITSDHGEMLGEHGLALHAYLYDENVMVPLIISSPDGRDAGNTVVDQVGSVDIVPTILELARLASADGIDGESLVPMMADPAPSPGSPRVEWGYAANTNHGISLRVDNRWKYLLYDSVWPAINGVENLYSLGPTLDETTNLAASSSETAGFRSLLRDSYLAEASGLRIELANGGASGFSGTIAGPMIKVNSVKSPDLPHDNPLTGAPSRRAAFQVPPSTSQTLVLIDPGQQWLDLRLAAERDDGTVMEFEERIDVAGIEGEIVIALTNAGWVRTRMEGQPETYVAIFWGGDFRPQQGMELAPDEELMQQLRALGYIQ